MLTTRKRKREINRVNDRKNEDNIIKRIKEANSMDVVLSSDTRRKEPSPIKEPSPPRRKSLSHTRRKRSKSLSPIKPSPTRRRRVKASLMNIIYDALKSEYAATAFITFLFDKKQNLLVIVNKQSEIQNIATRIKEFATTPKYKIEEKDSGESSTHVWLFQGKLIGISNHGSIAIEYGKNINLAALNAMRSPTEQFIVIHSFLINNSSNIKELLQTRYKKIDNLELFLSNVVAIFADCDLYYTFTAANILKNILSYANPPMENERPKSATPITPQEDDTADEVAPPIYNTADEPPAPLPSYTYDMIETEINALTLEASISVADSTNLRCLINSFITFINTVILRNNADGYCSKSGGEVYRYYGIKETITNDIDTKIFLTTKDPANILRIKREILTAMLMMRYIIRNQQYIRNLKIATKRCRVFNTDIEISYTSLPSSTYYFDSKVRSISIDIAKLKGTTDKGIRLFSIDTFKQMNIKVGGSLILHGLHQSSPLDIAIMPLGSTYDPVMAEGMYILSTAYLLKDLKFLLKSAERQEKNAKDKVRYAFIGTKPTVQPPIARALSVCSELSMNEVFNILYGQAAIQQDTVCHMAHFDKTITGSGRTYNNERYKTKFGLCADGSSSNDDDDGHLDDLN
jgi:hypothetical protein